MENKYKTFKNFIRIFSILIGIMLIILINTLGYSDLLDRIVKIFVFTTPVLGGLGAYLRRKEDEKIEDS